MTEGLDALGTLSTDTTRERPVPLSRRLYSLLATMPDGIESSVAAVVLGASWPTVSCTLARLFWSGRIDRYKRGRAFVYRLRPRA